MPEMFVSVGVASEDALFDSIQFKSETYSTCASAPVSTIGGLCIASATKWIQIQTKLHSYLGAASSDSIDDEADNIFGCMKRKCCEGSSFLSSLHMFINRWGQRQSPLGTPHLERIIPLGHSARASWHRGHETILHSLHLNVQIAALFARDCSGKPFHAL
jgi:hypothetical protein